jgi:hypothetical protein
LEETRADSEKQHVSIQKQSMSAVADELLRAMLTIAIVKRARRRRLHGRSRAMPDEVKPLDAIDRAKLRSDLQRHGQIDGEFVEELLNQADVQATEIEQLIEVVQAAPDFGGEPQTAFGRAYREWLMRLRTVTKEIVGQ